MCFSTPKVSTPPTAPPVASVTEITGEKGEAAQYSKQKERQRLAAMMGRQATIAAGQLEPVSSANIQRKSLG